MRTTTMTDDELLAAICAPEEQPKPKVNRIDFGGLKEKKPAGPGNSEYPVLPDPDGVAAQLADEFLLQHAVELAAKGAKESARAMIVEMAVPFHWETNCRRAEVAGTVSVRSAEGKEVLVQFKNAYKAIGDLKDHKSGKLIQAAEDRVKAIPAEIFAKYFRQTFSIEVDSTKIQEDKLQEVVNRIQTLADELSIQDAIHVSAAFRPVEEFHTARYQVLTAEQNIQIERSMGEKGLMTIACTAARGRKK